MNGKQARRLRKIVEETVGNALPERNYIETNHHERLFPTGRLDEQGNQKLVAIPLFTVELKDCKRDIYQSAKKLHHTFYGRD